MPERPTPSEQCTAMGQERPRYDLLTFLQMLRRRSINPKVSCFENYVCNGPSELQQRLRGRGNPVGGPRPEVELRDSPRLPRAGVLQVDGADEVVLAPDVLADEVNLEDVVLLGALGRPVAVAELEAVVLEPREHHDDDAALLPDHLPEVGHGAGEGRLAHDVGRVAGIVVNLERRRGKK